MTRDQAGRRQTSTLRGLPLGGAPCRVAARRRMAPPSAQCQDEREVRSNMAPSLGGGLALLQPAERRAQQLLSHLPMQLRYPWSSPRGYDPLRTRAVAAAVGRLAGVSAGGTPCSPAPSARTPSCSSPPRPGGRRRCSARPSAPPAPSPRRPLGTRGRRRTRCTPRNAPHQPGSSCRRRRRPGRRAPRARATRSPSRLRAGEAWRTSMAAGRARVGHRSSG